MKKAYIQPEFDLLKLSSSEDVLAGGSLEVNVGDGDGDSDWSGVGDGGFESGSWF